MNEVKWAIITGAGGGMGAEITRAVAKAGYSVIMACYHPEKAEKIRQKLMSEVGHSQLEIMSVDLSSMDSVIHFAHCILERNIFISLLMNNAGIIETGLHQTMDGFERTVSVNYLSPYLLTRKLLPVLTNDARIVNMISCTYAIGKLDFPEFFRQGRKGPFWRIPVYSNTKLALLLFTIALSERLRERGITVNAADPGIVSTRIIKMHQWFDPLTDIFFRPLIRTPQEGASTAIGLLLNEKEAAVTGKLYVSNRQKQLSDAYVQHLQKELLWNETEYLLKDWL